MVRTRTTIRPGESKKIADSIRGGASAGLSRWLVRVKKEMQDICPEDIGALKRSHRAYKDRGKALVGYFGFRETPETIANFYRKRKEKAGLDSFYGKHLHISGSRGVGAKSAQKGAVMRNWVIVAYHRVSFSLLLFLRESIGKKIGVKIEGDLV